jgi:hypothetical protein
VIEGDSINIILMSIKINEFYTNNVTHILHILINKGKKGKDIPVTGRGGP